MTQPELDWDDANIDHIGERHNIAPAEAEDALRDPRRIPGTAYSTATEQRTAVIGATTSGRILFVVITLRRGRVRVVTARDARPREERAYRGPR